MARGAGFWCFARAHDEDPVATRLASGATRRDLAASVFGDQVRTGAVTDADATPPTTSTEGKPPHQSICLVLRYHRRLDRYSCGSR